MSPSALERSRAAAVVVGVGYVIWGLAWLAVGLVEAVHSEILIPLMPRFRVEEWAAALDALACCAVAGVAFSSARSRSALHLDVRRWLVTRAAMLTGYAVFVYFLIHVGGRR